MSNKYLIEKKVREYNWKYSYGTLESMADDLNLAISRSSNNQVISYLIFELEVVLRAYRKTKRLTISLSNMSKLYDIPIGNVLEEEGV